MVLNQLVPRFPETVHLVFRLDVSVFCRGAPYWLRNCNKGNTRPFRHCGPAACLFLRNTVAVQRQLLDPAVVY